MLFFSFSRAQAYSHIPQPVHLLGSTETNFLDGNFEVGISIFKIHLVIKFKKFSSTLFTSWIDKPKAK
jgi:hypothetical protein